MSLTMMVSSACVNGSVHHLYTLLSKKQIVMGLDSSFELLITTCIWLMSMYFQGTTQTSVI